MQNTTGKEGNSDHVCKKILLIFIDKVKPMYLQLGVTFAHEEPFSHVYIPSVKLLSKSRFTIWCKFCTQTEAY